MVRLPFQLLCVLLLVLYFFWWESPTRTVVARLRSRIGNRTCESSCLRRTIAGKLAVDPLHFDKPEVVGVGLVRTFGIQTANVNKNVTVGVLPFAVRGSPISSREIGGYHEQTKAHPYNDAIHRSKAALAVGMLRGILWHQGGYYVHPGNQSRRGDLR